MDQQLQGKNKCIFSYCNKQEKQNWNVSKNETCYLLFPGNCHWAVIVLSETSIQIHQQLYGKPIHSFHW